MDIDIRVLKLEPQFRDEEFHTPLKFGGGIVRSTTSSTVRTESIDHTPHPMMESSSPFLDMKSVLPPSARMECL